MCKSLEIRRFNCDYQRHNCMVKRTVNDHLIPQKVDAASVVNKVFGHPVSMASPFRLSAFVWEHRGEETLKYPVSQQPNEQICKQIASIL
jgi:hypothetical protein